MLLLLCHLPSTFFVCLFSGVPLLSLLFRNLKALGTLPAASATIPRSKIKWQGQERKRGVCEKECVQLHWCKKLNLPSEFWLLRTSVAATTMGLFWGWGCSRMEQRKNLGALYYIWALGVPFPTLGARTAMHSLYLGAKLMFWDKVGKYWWGKMVTLPLLQWYFEDSSAYYYLIFSFQTLLSFILSRF